jgi:hypothetical protein
MAGMCLRQNSRRSRSRASSSSSNGRSKGEMIVSVRMNRSIGMHRLPFLLITVGMLVTMVTMVTAYTSNSPKRESRYFAQESMLPPLPRIDVDNSVIPSRESDRHLSVLYTNDPKMVSRWLSDNIGNDGCTLGFDLEVSNVLCGCSFILSLCLACECSFIRYRFIRVRLFHPSIITSHQAHARMSNEDIS